MPPTSSATLSWRGLSMPTKTRFQWRLTPAPAASSVAAITENVATSARPRLPELRLSVQYPGGKEGGPTRTQVRRWMRAACSVPAEVTVRFVGTEEGQTLNRDYRSKDYATNVLSFPYESGARICGDLVLCLPVIEREAKEQDKPAEAHYAHMVVHGMLHLQGYDHETGKDDAERMEALEREILADLGYPDPYA
ncbi:MAG: rRNA maturation RNase YbeY [Betaproteobacteria bacterium]|nr:rRNA maturation RNase YbeY [Betaproteobacteria bacterium]